MQKKWDIFCDIVDNFGDIGVCWRLAQQLTAEYPIEVRLWVNKLAVAKQLIPELSLESPSQTINGVQIAHWDSATSFETVAIADVVIEAFACELPPTYVAAMTQSTLWLNLEYLSAESWVDGLHGNISIHHATGLKKTFFFPGFTSHTGGLIRERQLLTQRDAYLASTGKQLEFWQSLGLDDMATSQAIKLSLFSYGHAPLATLFDSLASSPEPVVCLLPESTSQSLVKKVAAYFDQGTLSAGNNSQRLRMSKGSLTVQFIPFLSHQQYDHLLWSCDLNFVRGEDSWIRAIWAGKPFVWQPYRQDEAAHLTKLQAFLDVYYRGLAATAYQAIREAHAAWVDSSHEHPKGSDVFRSLLAERSSLHAHALRQAETLAMQDDLAAKLVIFCGNQV